MFEYGAFANSQSNEVAFTDTSFAGVSAILQAAFRSSEDREEDGSGAAEPVVQLPATASVTLEQDVSARTGVAIPFQWALSCHSHLLLAQLGVGTPRSKEDMHVPQTVVPMTPVSMSPRRGQFATRTACPTPSPSTSTSHHHPDLTYSSISKFGVQRDSGNGSSDSSGDGGGAGGSVSDEDGAAAVAVAAATAAATVATEDMKPSNNKYNSGSTSNTTVTGDENDDSSIAGVSVAGSNGDISIAGDDNGDGGGGGGGAISSGHFSATSTGAASDDDHSDSETLDLSTMSLDLKAPAPERGIITETLAWGVSSVAGGFITGFTGVVSASESAAKGTARTLGKGLELTGNTLGSASQAVRTALQSKSEADAAAQAIRLDGLLGIVADREQLLECNDIELTVLRRALARGGEEGLDEAKVLVTKMVKMRAILSMEEEEMAAHRNIMEIEAREKLLFPDVDPNATRAELSIGNDGFSKEMAKHGLLHKTTSVEGEAIETRIFHKQLPPSLDLFALQDFDEAPLDREDGVEVAAEHGGDNDDGEAAGSSSHRWQNN